MTYRRLASSDTPGSAPLEGRVAPWQAALGVGVGGVAAHVAGTLVALAVIVLLAVRGGPAALERLVTASPEALARDSAMPALLLASLLATEGVLLAAALATPWLFKARIGAALGLTPTTPAALALGVLGVVGIGPLGDEIARVLAEIAPWASLGSLPALSDAVATLPVSAALIGLAVLPGFAEELVFRGLLQRSFARPALAIGVSAVAFAAFHIDPHHVVATLPIGLYLAWLTARTQSTLPAILAHVVNNALGVVSLRMAVDTGAGASVALPGWWLFAGLGLLGAALVLIELVCRRPDAPAGDELDALAGEGA